MRKISLFLWLFTTGMAACSQRIPQAAVFPEQVGDIPFDKTKDDTAFTICDSPQVIQYYYTTSYYKEHKNELLKYFTNGFIPSDTLHQTGYLTIRFIINCKGHTGRFRINELDSNYQPFQFSEKISGQLLRLTKELKVWQPATINNHAFDSYQYITFRIKNGNIISMSP